jgi:hypothetical protein
MGFQSKGVVVSVGQISFFMISCWIRISNLNYLSIQILEKKCFFFQFKYLGWISYIQGFLFNSDQCFFCAEFSQPGDPKRKKKELANPTKDFLKKKKFKSPYLKKKNFRNPHILIVCSCN